MKRGRLQRTGALRRKTAPWHRAAPMPSGAQDAYRAATERARTPEGYLICEGCGRSLIDGQEQRHHVLYRSQGGQASADNIAVLCLACHSSMHGVRTVLPDVMQAVHVEEVSTAT
jgi:5-methylcytosine-specific restriction endonuclease McrA